MKRQMSTLQLVGAAFMATASWLGVTGGFSIGVVIGGSASLVFGPVIVTTFSELPAPKKLAQYQPPS
ncbi:hypothetical protein EDB81DRAFT_890188 [Dactylonectria macrodidyma]|uniref:Uncharacterized protein n=1 Tax=Dactylonectria macrodidyma TaxID=307937 RepID=A0A9P9ILG3_9HYPO|nr:hypothetical protein EDB81DRAFT_890188 [Dactylonectria macrodidyma]